MHQLNLLPSGNAGSAGTLGTAGSTPLGTSAGPIPEGIEVLSDTKGIDFCPYLSRVLQAVRMNWYTLIPEAARPPLLERGKVSIELAILPDGKVAGMKLNSPSGDVSLDRAAWGGITASNPFAPLPSEFNGQNLRLRFIFQYNPNKAATDNPKLMFSQMPSSPGRVIEEAARGTASGESGGNYGTGGTIPPSTSAKRIPQGVEILSDTQGVDFFEYPLRMSRAVASYWHGELGPKVSDLKSGVDWVPYQKSGVTKVEFKILRDGSVTGMKMTQPSGDAYLDRVAWNAIAITPLTSVTSHFERLPLAFKGQELRLRLTFQYNPKAAATDDPTKNQAH